MKLLRYLAIAIVLCVCASAQTVTITLQVTDAGGQSWNNGTWSAQLTGCSTSGCNILGTTTPVPNQQQSGVLSASGGASIVVTPVNSIAPAGTKWVFQVCPNATSPCFQNNIAPTSNVTFNDTPPAITINMASPQPIFSAYADGELFGQVPGNQYFNTTLGLQKLWNGSTWILFNAGTLGLGDPGANGIVKRTALNTTTVAAVADIIALFSGTCNTTTFLRGDGSCAATGGGGGTPGGLTTQLQYNNAGAFGGTADTNGNIPSTFTNSTGRVGICNESDIRYALCYNWTQSPTGSLTGGVQATVTLTPGPRGIDTSNNATFPFFVYIAGTGTAEAVQVTGGTCVIAGSASCNIIFTPVNSHAAGFTIQSATTGAAEAGLDAPGRAGGVSNVKVVLQPASAVTGNNTNPFIFYAPWFVTCGSCTIDGRGATVVLNNKRAAIVLNSNTFNAPVVIENIRFLPESLGFNGATITNTVCTANVATITTTLNPAVGDVIDIQFTANSFYWGPHVVTSSSASQWTYTATGCSQVSQATAGFNAWQGAAIEDNGQHTQMKSLYITFGGAPFNAIWNNGIVVLDDQDAIIDGITFDGHGDCGSGTYCGSAIYAPGTFSNGPAVLKIHNSDISPGCSFNGVTHYNGNTTVVKDTVIQGYPMWAIRGGIQRGGFGATQTDNVYTERGSCTNPFYTPDQSEGFDQFGETLTTIGGEGPQGTMPLFASGGGTTYYYFVVVNASGSPSTPLWVGFAQPSGTAVTVAWPRANDSGTITYDVLRQTNATFAPTSALCTGGSTTACGSVVVGQAQCSTLQCTFTDNVSTNTTAYTILTPTTGGSGIGGAVSAPTFNFFPGDFILENGAWLNYIGGNINSNALISGVNGAGLQALNGVGPVFTDAVGQHSLGYAHLYVAKPGEQDNNGVSDIRIIEPHQSGGTPTNAKGRIHFISDLTGQTGGQFGQGAHWITFADCTSQSAIAANSHRPGNQDPLTACSTGIGSDLVSGATTNPGQIGLGITNPNAISFYINSLIDNSSWKFTLRPSLATFTTAVTSNGTVTGSSIVASSGTVSTTSGPVSGNFNCFSITPVTVSTSTTNDQNLMACTIPAGTLNSVGKTLRIHTKSVYSTPAASTATLTFKAKLCSVSGCGSGNVATLVSIASSANAGSITNNTAILDVESTTQTAGAASRSEASGILTIDLAALATGAATPFGDTNATTIAGSPADIDFTAQNFLQITVAFSVASGSNTVMERQLVVDSVN